MILWFCVLIDAVLVVFDIHSQIQFQLGLSFPNFITGCLDKVSAFLPFLCFHPLYASFLCLNLAGSSLFIHTDLLAFLPDFVFVGMEISWAHKRNSKKLTNQKWLLVLVPLYIQDNFIPRLVVTESRKMKFKPTQANTMQVRSRPHNTTCGNRSWAIFTCSSVPSSRKPPTKRCLCVPLKWCMGNGSRRWEDICVINNDCCQTLWQSGYFRGERNLNSKWNGWGYRWALPKFVQLTWDISNKLGTIKLVTDAWPQQHICKALKRQLDIMLPKLFAKSIREPSDLGICMITQQCCLWACLSAQMSQSSPEKIWWVLFQGRNPVYAQTVSSCLSCIKS